MELARVDGRLVPMPINRTTINRLYGLELATDEDVERFLAERAEPVEYPRSEGDPYYPIPRDDTRALYRRYEALGEELPEVTFVGRLARYQYLNMDQVVGQALSTAAKLMAALPEPA